MDDPSCTDIGLGSQTYFENVSIDRTVSVSGVSSTQTVIAGRVEITGASTVVTLTDLAVDASDPSVAGCFREAVDVTGGSRMSGSNLVVTNGPGSACVMFGDGFEDGTTDAWSNTVP